MGFSSIYRRKLWKVMDLGISFSLFLFFFFFEILVGLRRENKAEVKKKMVEKGFEMRGIGSRVYISTKENSKRRRKKQKGVSGVWGWERIRERWRGLVSLVVLSDLQGVLLDFFPVYYYG